MYKNVFISYRRTDEPLAALLLYSFLLEVLPRPNVFLDTEKIKLGESFPTRLMEAISNSNFCLAIVGRHWDGGSVDGLPSRLFDPTDFVRNELLHAFEMNKTTIPIFVGTTSFKNQQVPTELAKLKQLQGFAIRADHFKYDAQQLFVQSRICSERELVASSGKNEKLLQTQQNLMVRFLEHMGVAFSAGIGTTIAMALSRESSSHQRKVVIYTTPRDHNSGRLKDLLLANKVPFIEHDMTKDLEKRNEMIRITEQMGSPVALVDDQVVIGCDEWRLRELIGLAPNYLDVNRPKSPHEADERRRTSHERRWTED